MPRENVYTGGMLKVCVFSLSWNAQFPQCCRNGQLIGPCTDGSAESSATRIKCHRHWLELPAMLLPCLRKAENRRPVAGEASYVFLCSAISAPPPGQHDHNLPNYLAVLLCKTEPHCIEKPKIVPKSRSGIISGEHQMTQ